MSGTERGHTIWLFAGSMRGGRAAAVIYTLVESCKAVGVDVLTYLADVLVRVADATGEQDRRAAPGQLGQALRAAASRARVGILGKRAATRPAMRPRPVGRLRSTQRNDIIKMNNSAIIVTSAGRSGGGTDARFRAFGTRALLFEG